MNTSNTERGEAQSRASRRLRSMTIGTAVLGVAATGLRFVSIGGGQGSGGGMGGSSGISSRVTSACTAVMIGGSTTSVYDCAGAASG